MSGIVIDGLRVNYGEKSIFNNFNLQLAENKISVLLGGSGVGKTTLLNAIAGLKEYEGNIDGTESGVSYIFQRDRLIPTITVYKNLDLILRGVCNDKHERRKRIEDMLALLDIPEQIDKLPTQLSGGQAQRVAMARAYLYPSKVLLLDEPFRALDTALKARLLARLVALNADTPRTVIFVTHAIDECLLAADDYYVLSGEPAQIVLYGSIEMSKQERKLTDSALSIVRNKLLDVLTLQSYCEAQNETTNA